jgi:hypothetical protein
MVAEAEGRTIALLRATALSWPGVNTVEPEPIGGLEPAHALEQAAHLLIKDLIRLAWQAGAASLGLATRWTCTAYRSRQRTDGRGRLRLRPRVSGRPGRAHVHVDAPGLRAAADRLRPVSRAASTRRRSCRRLRPLDCLISGNGSDTGATINAAFVEAPPGPPPSHPSPDLGGRAYEFLPSSP